MGAEMKEVQNHDEPSSTGIVMLSGNPMSADGVLPARRGMATPADPGWDQATTRVHKRLNRCHAGPLALTSYFYTNRREWRYYRTTCRYLK